VLFFSIYADLLPFGKTFVPQAQGLNNDKYLSSGEKHRLLTLTWLNTSRRRTTTIAMTTMSIVSDKRVNDFQHFPRGLRRSGQFTVAEVTFRA
jgi:hypothetical protein